MHARVEWLLAMPTMAGVAACTMEPSAPTSAYHETPQVNVAQSFDHEVAIHVKLNYPLALPRGYDDPARASEKWPLLLFLHGIGECGDDLEVVKKHGPPRRINEGHELPAIVVSPQAARPGWDPVELNGLLDDLVARLRVDVDRVYLAGLSMGGFGTWALACERPDRFAALVPICGAGDPLAVKRLKEVPIWVFHGRKDPLIPCSKSEELVQALEAAGAHPKFTLYDDLAHDCWTRTYADPELWKWLFEQRRLAKR